MEMGFGDMDSIDLLINKIQWRKFVAEPSASNTYICALNQEGRLSSDLFMVTWRAYANRGDVYFNLLSVWFGALTISLPSEYCAISCVLEYLYSSHNLREVWIDCQVGELSN
jgi:hypothetical protein